MNSQGTFLLDNFVGTLDFLIHLIDKQEVSISEIPVKHLTSQLSDKMPMPVDTASEWIYSVSYIAWLKSKSLLPVHEQVIQIEEESDPHFDIIHHLVDYCRFKDVAKQLLVRQEEQSGLYMRGAQPLVEKQRGPLQPISLDQLQELFRDILKRVPVSHTPIQDEALKVSDKISELRALILTQEKYPFLHLFNVEKSRMELIVTFLALLELMKSGELFVSEEDSSKQLFIISGRYR